MQVAGLRAFYKRERNSGINSPADELRISSLMLSNVSSGIRIADAEVAAASGAALPQQPQQPQQGARVGSESSGSDAAPPRWTVAPANRAEAWAAEEEERERFRDELQVCECLFCVC